MAEKNRVGVDIEVTNEERASAAFKSLKGESEGFANSVNRAGESGLRLRDIFTGNLLAEYFRRGADAAIAFGADSVRAAAAASDANRRLEFSATQAGLSYVKAAELAEGFGKRVGASNTEAAGTFSDIIRLAERAGRAGDVDKLSRGFADLAAARGIKGAELSSLIGTILSGQDEGLNRLGADDPGKLNAAYAASIHKNAEALTIQEKAAAAVLALEKLMAQAQGESERRLRGTAGQLDATAASWENLKTQIGETITTSVTFRDLLTTITDALGSVVTSHEEARRQLAKGLKTPEQLAREARESTGAQIWNAAKGVLSAGFYLSPVGQAANAYQMLGRSAEEIAAINKSNYDAIFNPGQRQEAADLQRFRGIQKDSREQEAKAQQNANKPTVATPDPNAAKKALQEAEAAYKSALGFIDELSERSTGGANPFIKLFTAGETAAERMRERFGALGDVAVNEFTRMEQKAIDFEVANQRIQSSLKAVELEFQAEALKRPFVGLTGEQERTLAVLRQTIEAAKNVPVLQSSAEQIRLANQYRFGFNGNPLLLEQRGFNVGASGQIQSDPDHIAEQQFKRLTGLLGRFGNEPGYAGAQMRDEINRQLTSLFEGLTPQARARVAQSPKLTDAFARAYDEQAKFQEAQIGHQLELNKAGRYGVDLANAKLSQLAKLAPGEDADVIRKQFLEITKGLDPKELTGALKQGMIAALGEEARHVREQEKEAKSFREQLVGQGGILYQIKAAIEKAGGAKSLGAGASLPSALVDGEDYGPPVVTEQKYYPSKEAYEAATGKARNGSTPFAFFGPDSPFNPQNAPGASVVPSTDTALMDAFRRAKESGRIVADFAAAFAPDFAAVGSPVAVNPFAQDLFRARPGYSPANDPRSLDTSNPLIMEFYKGGYFNNVQSAGATTDDRARRIDGVMQKLDAVLTHKGLKLDGDAAKVQIEVTDQTGRANVTGDAW